MMIVKEFLKYEDFKNKKRNHPKFFTSNYFESIKAIGLNPVNLKKHTFLTLNNLGEFIGWNIDNIMFYMHHSNDHLLMVRKHEYTTLSFVMEKRAYLRELNSVYGLRTVNHDPDIGIAQNVVQIKPEKVIEKHLYYIEKVSNTLIDPYLKRSYV